MCLPALLASNCLCAWARNGGAQVDGYIRYVIKALCPMVRACRCALCLRMLIPRALICACGMLGCRILLASQPFRSENAESIAWKCRRLAYQATVSRPGFVFDSKAITVTEKCKLNRPCRGAKWIAPPSCERWPRDCCLISQVCCTCRFDALSKVASELKDRDVIIATQASL